MLNKVTRNNCAKGYLLHINAYIYISRNLTFPDDIHILLWRIQGSGATAHATNKAKAQAQRQRCNGTCQQTQVTNYVQNIQPVH